MANSSKLSKEHETFCSYMKCPLCRRSPIIPTYFKHGNVQVSRNVAISAMDSSATAQCPKCKGRWAVFSNSNQSVSGQGAQNVSPKDSTSIDNLVDSRLDAPLRTHRIELSETERIEEPIGSERRTIDNLKGSGSVTRKLTITKEWSKTYTIDFEKAITAHGGINFKLLKVINLEASVEGSLRKRYSITQEIRNTYFDEVSVEILPETKVEYLFQWKRICQKGNIKCFDQFDREFAVIPFQIVVGLTFDISSR